MESLEQPIERAEVSKLLFVCSLNKRRSLTAERLFDRFDRYQVRSRGTEQGARIKVTEGDIGWADIIFTMEKRHTERLRKKFREKLRGKRIVTLFIDDNYEPMEKGLIRELLEKLRRHIDLS